MRLRQNFAATLMLVIFQTTTTQFTYTQALTSKQSLNTSEAQFIFIKRIR